MRKSELDIATDWGRVGMLFLIGCTVAFHMGKIPAALPFITKQLNLSLFGSSWIVSVFSVLIGSCGLVIGVFAGRLNYRIAATMGLLTAGAGSLGGAFADSLSLLLLSRAFEGLGWILTAVSIPVLMGCVTHRSDSSIVLGLWGAFVPAGMTIAMLASPAILTTIGWEGLWIVTGVTSVLAALVLFGLSRNFVIPPSHKLTIRDAVSEIAQWAPLMMFGCFLVYAAQFTSVTSFVPTLLMDKYAIGIKLSASLGALVVAANIVGNVAAGWLLKRGLLRHHLLVAAMVAMGAMTVLIFQDHISLGLRVLASIIFAASGGIIPGTLFATAPLVVRNPVHVGIINGLILQASGIGQLLGPPFLTGVVEFTDSWATASVFTTALCAVGIICALILGRKIR